MPAGLNWVPMKNTTFASPVAASTEATRGCVEPRNRSGKGIVPVVLTEENRSVMPEPSSRTPNITKGGVATNGTLGSKMRLSAPVTPKTNGFLIVPVFEFQGGHGHADGLVGTEVLQDRGRGEGVRGEPEEAPVQVADERGA